MGKSKGSEKQARADRESERVKRRKAEAAERRENTRRRILAKISASLQKSNWFGNRPSDLKLVQAAMQLGCVAKDQIYTVDGLCLILGRSEYFIKEWIKRELPFASPSRGVYFVTGRSIIQWVERKIRDETTSDGPPMKDDLNPGLPAKIRDDESYNESDLTWAFGFAWNGETRDWAREHEIPFNEIYGTRWYDGRDIRNAMRKKATTSATADKVN
ncbi:MAG: hypothetical protein F9B45_16535 [Phycisphaera sp. RhM]|nr:hypothetical protein [Phycisphaera sp. RhM]